MNFRGRGINLKITVEGMGHYGLRITTVVGVPWTGLTGPNALVNTAAPGREQAALNRSEGRQIRGALLALICMGLLGFF